jgi:hypothetical protein
MTMTKQYSSRPEAVYCGFSAVLSLGRQTLMIRRYCCGTLKAANLFKIQITTKHKVLTPNDLSTLRSRSSACETEQGWPNPNLWWVFWRFVYLKKAQNLPGKAANLPNDIEIVNMCSRLCCRAGIEQDKCFVCKKRVMHRTGISTLKHLIIQPSRWA